MTRAFLFLFLSLGLLWLGLLLWHPSGTQQMPIPEDPSTHLTDFTLPRNWMAHPERFPDVPLGKLFAKGCLTVGDIMISPFPPNKSGAIGFLCVFIPSFWATLLLFARNREVPLKRGILLLVSLAFSWLFIGELERANTVLAALTFSFIFLAWHDSASKWKRVIAAVSLGTASALKVSPCFLGFLYLIPTGREDRFWPSRDWQGIAVSGLTAILLFFGPFVLLGDGLGDVSLWLEHANREASVHPSTWGLHGVARYGAGVLSQVAPWLTIEGCRIVTILAGLLLSGCLIVFSFCRVMTDSDRLFLLTASMLILCLNSQFYLGLMLFPSLILWLKEVDDRGHPTELDYIELILWILMLMPLQIVIGGRSTTIFITFATFWTLTVMKIYICFRRMWSAQNVKTYSRHAIMEF